MRFPLGEMTVGDILDRGLKLLFARLPAFYTLNLIVLSPLILYQIVVPILINSTAADPRQIILYTAGSGLVVIVLTIILSPLATAALLHMTMQEFVGRRKTVAEALGFATTRLGSLILTSLLVGLVVALGFLACIAPGVYFAVSYIFVGQVVVLEGLSGGAAMSRSSNLISGHRGRVFGVVLLIAIGGGMVQAILAVGLQTVMPSQRLVPTANGMRVEFNSVNHVVQTLITQLLGIVFSTYQAVCTTLLYLDLRIRKEGFDLELAAQGDTPPAADDIPGGDLR
jgi:hypothetical protein